ncbi:MAG: hypothetical protein ACREXO_22215, partial [Advenella sp.]
IAICGGLTPANKIILAVHRRRFGPYFIQHKTSMAIFLSLMQIVMIFIIYINHGHPASNVNISFFIKI